MTDAFFTAGFSAPVVACSATPLVDGYIAQYKGNPYQIHPTATPTQWALLATAINDGSIVAESYVAPSPPPVHLPSIAQIALTKSDLVAMRCFKAGVAYPSAWQNYTDALRAIINGTDTTSTVLPSIPSYPAGT